MIELTEEQQRALQAQEQPPEVVDPRTGQLYRLIKQEVYNTLCGIMKPFNRDWDPDEDLIRRDA